VKETKRIAPTQLITNRSRKRTSTALHDGIFAFGEVLKAWPHDHENHTKSSDDSRELSSRYDQPYSHNK